MQNVEIFRELVSSPGKVIITTHHKPDADALGSSLALAGYLKKKGHQVNVISPTDYASFLAWMKGNEEVIVYEEQKVLSAQLIQEADIVCCLDFSNLARLNELGEIVAKSSAKKVLIDHHLQPDDFADFMYWSTAAAATAELTYQLIEDMEDTDLIDADMAESLYAGIMTDTGSFKHPNTTGNVFKVCADLVGKGADTAKVAKLIYDSNSVDRVKFLGFALSERLTILPEYNTAYFAISSDDLKRFKSQTGDTEGLVNYALSITGIKFATLIVDRSVMIKISFRSIGEFSVNEFARKHFEGGGHRNAAGGKSELTLEDTVAKFEGLVKEYKEQLSNTIKTYA
ncbi:bifunctional oligoribonuclease/PAP phosphatase NrnA [Fulvivirga sp. M361]|uniref:DHH family phosphoesterase n=1 Tax=Fulvivirga sp. M361 TaxID=2594266 RepID=UPI00117A71DF|nr:DHH family phosphoesterase [Fulvivirga sp. M361]TRX61265.1 bifunctional oligoribonuclease/PAP phosphatase NrnA [Fulvivirga sp. M361]